MDIKKYIENTKPYFREFNILDDLSYVFVSFPENWTIPGEEYIKESFKTEIAKEKDGYYFCSDLSNGTDLVFDAVQYVITYNKKLEEKYNLFNQKTEELIQIFKEYDLDQLNTLQFTFAEKPIKKAKKTAKKETVKTKKNENTSKKPDIPVEEKKEEPKQEELPKIVQDDSIMSLAKKMVGE